MRKTRQANNNAEIASTPPPGHSLDSAVKSAPPQHTDEDEEEDEEAFDIDSGTDYEGKPILNDMGDAPFVDKIMERRGMFSAQNPPSFKGWARGWDTEGSVELGNTLEASARLYLRYNDEQQIVDRVVMKDAFLDHREWNCSHKWYGRLQDGMPMEVHCMQATKDRPGSKYCVELRGSHKVQLSELRYQFCKCSIH